MKTQEKHIGFVSATNPQQIQILNKQASEY